MPVQVVALEVAAVEDVVEVAAGAAGAVAEIVNNI